MNNSFFFAVTYLAYFRNSFVRAAALHSFCKKYMKNKTAQHYGCKWS